MTRYSINTASIRVANTTYTRHPPWHYEVHSVTRLFGRVRGQEADMTSNYDPRDFSLSGRDVANNWVLSIVLMSIVFSILEIVASI